EQDQRAIEMAAFEHLAPPERAGGVRRTELPKSLQQILPESTRRSSTLGIPRVSVGKSGSIRAHCSSENQKKSAIDGASSPEASETHRGNHVNPVYGSGP